MNNPFQSFRVTVSFDVCIPFSSDFDLAEHMRRMDGKERANEVGEMLYPRLTRANHTYHIEPTEDVPQARGAVVVDESISSIEMDGGSFCVHQVREALRLQALAR